MKYKNIVLLFLLAVLFLSTGLSVGAPAAPVKTVVIRIPLTLSGG